MTRQRQITNCNASVAAAVSHHLPSAVTFKAWIIGTPKEPINRDEAWPAEIYGNPQTEQEAADSVASDICLNRQIMVLRSDDAQRPETRHRVTLFEVKRKRTGWDTSGTSKRARAIYTAFAKPLSRFCVREGFDPVRPWRMEDGNAVGCDLTLVQQ